MDIPRIYLVDIHGISKDIHGISSLRDIHGISKDIPCISHVYVGHLHIRGIFQAYSRHIPTIGVPDRNGRLEGLEKFSNECVSKNRELL